MSRRKMKSFRIDEISGVDNPAQEHARAVIMKRAPADPATARAPGGGGVQPSGTPSSNPGQEDPMTKHNGTDLEAQVNALTKAVKSAGGTIKKDDDGSFSVAFNALDTLIAELSKKGVTVEKADTGAPEITVNHPQPEETVKLADGSEIAKSQVPEPLLKQINADRARIEKLEADREADNLAKRAEAEVPNLVGEAATKAAILKAIDGIEDKATREAAHQTIKAANQTVGQLSKAVGISVHKSKDGAADDDPLAKLNAERDEIMKSDTKLSKAQAFVKAMEKRPELAAEYNARKQEAH